MNDFPKRRNLGPNQNHLVPSNILGPICCMYIFYLSAFQFIKVASIFSFFVYGILRRCIRYLQEQEVPKGVDLADDELILHVEGTASTQRVVRHIGGKSWPGLS